MPRAARAFTHVKQNRSNPAAKIGRPQVKTATKTRLGNDQLFQLLWADSYWPIVELTLDRDPALVDLLKAYIHGHRSKYAPFGVKETPMEYFERHQLKLVNVVQLLTTIGHQQTSANDPWKLIKTLAAMKQKMRRVQWDAEVKQCLILDMKLAKKQLKLMQAAKPKSDTNVSEHMAMNCSDQLMLWRGCTKRRAQRQSFERTDSEGNKVLVEKNTILMMTNHVVDADDFPMTNEEAEEIREDGVWVKHPDEILQHLDWDACQEHLYETMDSLTAIILDKFVDGDGGYDPEPHHMLHLLVRPDYNPGGATERDILRPIPDCDTNNLKDMNSYGVHLLAMHPDVVALLVHMDAQGNIYFLLTWFCVLLFDSIVYCYRNYDFQIDKGAKA